MRTKEAPREGVAASAFRPLGFVLHRRTLVGNTLVAIAFACTLFGSARAENEFGDRDDRRWVGTWGASPQPPVPLFSTQPMSFSNQTVREIVRISTGGQRIRVRLSNEYSTQPLTIGAAHIAISAGGSAIKIGTDRPLTFGGQTSIVIPPGAPVLSDPVELRVPDLASLTVSIYLPQTTGLATWHPEGVETAYVVLGDSTGAASFGGGATTSPARFFLTGIDAGSNERKRTIVTFGDSITDGTNSTRDANHRWPDRLAERLAASGDDDFGIVNQGISGNRILHENFGPNALSRLDRDVLATPGVRFVTVLLGINDIGFGGFNPSETVTADQIIGGYRQLIARAHSNGLPIYGGTLTPFDNVGAPYFSPEHEVVRQAVNVWIRTSGEFDAVLDFDKVIRDPKNPSKMLPEFDSGDHLHPSDAGYKAMADSIDLRLFRRRDDEAAAR